MTVPPSTSPLASSLPPTAKVKSSAVIRIVPTVVLLPLLTTAPLLPLLLTVIAPWKLNTLAKMLTNGLTPRPMMLP